MPYCNVYTAVSKDNVGMPHATSTIMYAASVTSEMSPSVNLFSLQWASRRCYIALPTQIWRRMLSK